MAKMHLTKTKKIIMLVLALIAVISSVVVSIAVFTDRVNRTTTIQVSTFDDDGYSIERTAPNGYVTASETLEVTLKESNDKSEDITSQITMTVSWESPVPNVYPWGNSDSGNAVIKLGGTEVSYTVNADKTITFTLPETALKAGSDATSILTFQISADLASTGKLNFNFDQIELGYAGWTADYDDTKLSALDFSVDVAWNISKNPTNTVTGKPNLDVIAVLKDEDKDGKYELEIIKNGSDDNTNKGQMMDWTAAGETPWADYPIEDLTIDDSVTTIGDYAFAGETGITSVDLPDTITHIGQSAFDGSGLTGELVIPASVKEIESLAFGNLPGVDTITFEHDADDKLTLPDNEADGKENTGAFYVPTYVKTTINTENEAIKYDYSWHNDNRRPIPTLAAQDTWYTGTTAKNAISSIEILDYYTPAGTLAEAPWDASSAQDGSVMAYVENDGSGNGTYKLTISGNGYGSIYANADSAFAFGCKDSSSAQAFSKASSISGLDLLDTANTTTMEGMFASCTSVTSLDISHFDTQKVTSMSGMFSQCSSMTSLDISNASVTMNDRAYTSWDTGAVKDMSGMFYSCSALPSIETDGFDTQSVEDMSYMFANCAVLTSVDVGCFDTQKVTTMESMFDGCCILPKLDVKLESVTLNGRTFTAWDTGAVTTMERMFADCNTLTAMDPSNWDATSVVTMFEMFKNCRAMPSINLSNFKTSSALKNMGSTFYGCQLLPSIDLSSFTTSGLEDMSLTFFSCYALTDFIRGDSFDATSVTTLNGIFGYCKGLTTLDLGNFKVSSVLTNMYQMFRECTNLQSVDFGDWNTSNVTNMANLFYKCRALTVLDLSMFDTAKVTTTSTMFNECNILTTIYVSQRWSNASNTYSTSMFSNCYDLVGGAGTTYSTAIIDKTRALIDGEGGKPGYFTNNIFLSYEDVKVGETVDPNLTIKSAVFNNLTGIKYEVVDGSEYAYVNASTGVVTGKAKGTATIRVTLTAKNGDVISADAQVNVLAVSITGAILTYDDVRVGETVDPGLTITPSNHGGYQSTTYEVIEGTEYAKVDKDSGVVTGLKEGTATIRVTIVDANGDSVTTTGTVTVINPVPILASQQTWYTQGGTSVAKSKITSIAFQDSYSPSSYVERWDASDGKVGTVTAYLEDDGTGSTYKLTIAGNGYGKIYTNADSAGAFRDFSSATAISGMSILDTSNTTIMRSMFNSCSKLTSLDVSTFETQNVTDMCYMFNSCSLLTTIPVGSWNTGKVTDMEAMFASCTSLISVDVSAWTVSNVECMDYMFDQCKVLPSLAVTNWNVGSVKSARAMFQNCAKLATLDVSKWTFSTNLTNTSYMFNGCKILSKLEVANWITDNVTTMAAMFNECETLATLAVDNWDTGSVGDMDYMFAECSSLSSLNVSKWDVSSVTGMELMFSYCYALPSLSVDSWQVQNVKDMRAMFVDCRSLTSLNVSNWKTSALAQITHTRSEYSSSTGLTYYWDLGMFEGCTKLATIDISGWDMDQITNSAHMFYNCYALKSLTIPASLSVISPEFAYNCTALTEITFNHGASDALSMPTAGAASAERFTTAPGANGEYSDGGAFYVSSYLATTINATNTTAKNYAWATDNRAKALPVLSYRSTWYTNGGSSISPKDITSIEIKDSYTPTGTVVDSWDASEGEVGTVTAYIEDDGTGSTYKLTIAGNGYGSIFANDDSSYAFSNTVSSKRFSNLTSITGLELLDTGNAVNMNYMFFACSTLPSLDVSSFDTSNVETMADMFGYCKALTTLNLSTKQVTLNGRTYNSWDTGKVTNTSYMFELCWTLTSLDVSHFDTRAITTATYMFNNCQTLTSLNLSSKSVSMNGRIFDSWDTGSLQNMGSMFSVMYKLSDLDLSHFDTSNVTNMGFLFSNSEGLASINVSSKSVSMNDRTFDSWDTGSAENMEYMFCTCKVLTELDVSHFDTSKVLNLNEMFSSCLKLADLDFSTKSVTLNGRTFDSWDTGSVENMRAMFSTCHAQTSLDTSHFDTSSVKNMSSMFYYCDGLTSLNISSKSMTLNGRNFTSWQTGSVIDMAGMFASCRLLTTLNLSHFDTAEVTDMSQMFRYCEKLYTLNISNFNTSKVTDMGQMFNNCYVLLKLDLNHFDTSAVTDMYQMFAFCYDLSSVTFSSNFKTSNVDNMAAMFISCESLTTLDLSSFDTSAITSSDGLDGFAYNTESLETITLNANFVTDSTLLPPSGFDPPGMFYTSVYIDTTIINASDAMAGYDWDGDNRTPSFVSS